MIKQLQLIQHAHRATETIRKGTTDPEHLGFLDGILTVLNELALRENKGFYVELYVQGCNLLARMAARVGQRQPLLSAAQVAPDSEYDKIGTALVELQYALTESITSLSQVDDKVGLALLAEVADWQCRLNARSKEVALVIPDNEGEGITPAGLSNYLKEKFPDWTNLEIIGFTRLFGGFSKTTILVELKDDLHGHREFVIRSEQAVNLLFYQGADVKKEFAMVKLMQQQGIPVAEPLWLEDDPSALGTRFIVFRKVEGRNVGGNLASNEPLSDALLDDLLNVMIRLHSIEPDWDDALVQQSHLPEWREFKTLTECTRYYVTDYFRNLIRENEIVVTPDIERAMQWLVNNVPENDDSPSVIHIDFALNNLLVEGDRIVAVLDWESSRLGDPAEELLSSYSSLASNISFEELLEIYCRNTGREISPFRLKYFKITKYVLNAITILRAEKMLEISDQVNISLAKLALPYRGHFLVELNSLIEEAEAVRKRV
jgi:aminoglycoside phosphotransferase (APT) family kinase protein